MWGRLRELLAVRDIEKWHRVMIDILDRTILERRSIGQFCVPTSPRLDKFLASPGQLPPCGKAKTTTLATSQTESRTAEA